MSMRKLKMKQESKLKNLLSEDETENTSSSSSSSTSTETSDDGTTTTTTTEQSQEETSSQESTEETSEDSTGDDMGGLDDMGMDDSGGTDDGSMDDSSSMDGGMSSGNDIPNSDKKIRLLRDYNELKQTSIFLLDSCNKIKELEETRSGKENKVLNYMVTRMEDVVEKIKFIILNKFISFDYTKLLTLYITLQANVYAVMNLLENVYGVDSNAKPDKDKK